MEPLVNQVVLVGDKKPYITALLTINLTSIKGLKNDNQTGIDQNEPLHKAVKEAVARVNKQLADFERIRRFKVLERDFSIENGELTPTMKIRRARVLELHKDLVSELYLGREESE
jgi:long-chain acyl-CoA synthetase